MKRLLRLVLDDSDPPPVNMPRTLLSAAGSLIMSNILLMKLRSSALLASVPKIAERAAPRPLVTVASDSPSALLAFETRLGVIKALTPSMKLFGCIAIDELTRYLL
jgi:hypothetical protein